MTIVTWRSLVRKYQKKLGKESGTIFVHLLAEVRELKYKWSEYQELFGTNPERIAVLNQVAPRYFAHLQSVLLDDVLLHVARITDRTTTAGKTNLTVRGLSSISANKRFQNKLKKSIDKVVKKTEFCRDWRNKRIAHADFNYRTSSKVKLRKVTREKVSKCIDEIHDILNMIEEKFFDSSLASSGAKIGGALDLLYVIDDGIRFRSERDERLSKGQILPQDLREDKRTWR